MLRKMLITAGVIKDVPLATYEPDTEAPSTVEAAIELLKTARGLLYASGWSSERVGRFLHEFAATTERQGIDDR